ncbi:TetR/AcrR family acrAB operon transcriptional repressor [Pseudochelatococcus lubricantis]|uniref:TetR/AcrR family acrAB operon transcriptional repressor n=1 Tax=Pseudochelatococcus lubricantis TaxID=1538102 RepID=A0ABX0V132_9HYPH|nr:TetR/AcrR family transcriptional regulator [Pseudochelatococcus lubricantis]NIJ58861.1 TetR/AcrR family acrAB operon transcriptional repressor [Pseudochelatococcus lubricantis]
MRRTKEQAAETGRQILQAAESLFLDKGFDKVSLEEIAAAAGVTRGAVHWHFRNKQGLLTALRDRAQEPFRKLAQTLSESPDAASLAKLGDLIAEMFERLQTDPRQQGMIRGIMRLDIVMADNAEEGGSTFREEMVKHFAQIFQLVERDVGLPPPWSPQTAAVTLNAAVSGLVGEWALDKGRCHLVPEGQAFIKLVLSSWTREQKKTGDDRPAPDGDPVARQPPH